jgi:hypothetical protein
MPVHSQQPATSPARLARTGSARTTQINLFCMQHERHLEAPAGVHIGSYLRGYPSDCR